MYTNIAMLPRPLLEIIAFPHLCVISLLQTPYQGSLWFPTGTSDHSLFCVFTIRAL